MEESKKKIKEVKEVIEITKVTKVTVEEFCVIENLDKYYKDSLMMSFPKEVKTVKEWEKFLVDEKLISKEKLNN